MKLGKLVEEKLKVRGLHYSTASSVRDLGIDATSGARRRIGVARSRLKAAQSRAGRIAMLVRVNQKATKLFSTGLWPSVAYGMENLGFSKTAMGTLRRQQAATSGYHKAGTCATTCIAIGHGQTADALISFTRGIVKN